MKTKKILLSVLVAVIVFAAVAVACFSFAEAKTAQADTTYISTVYAKLLTPVHGEAVAAKYDLAIVNANDENAYYCYANEHNDGLKGNWFDETANKDLFKGDTFIGGHVYTYKVTLIASSGKSFTIEKDAMQQVVIKTSAFVNGKKAELNKLINFDDSEPWEVDDPNWESVKGAHPRRKLVLSYTFEAIPESPVKELRLYNVCKPYVNQSPVYTASAYDAYIQTSDVVVNTDMGINGIYWTDVAANKFLKADDSFVLGKTYQFDYYLKVADGYYFDAEVKVYLDDEPIKPNYNNAYMMISKNYVCGKNPIDEVSIINVPVPAFDEYVLFTGSSEHLGSNWTFIANGDLVALGASAWGINYGVAWTDVDTGNTLSEGDKFQADKEYRATFYLKADNDYGFAMKGSLSAVNATINGNTAYCTPIYSFDADYDDYLKIEYTFAPTGSTVKNISVSNIDTPMAGMPLYEKKSDGFSVGEGYYVCDWGWQDEEGLNYGNGAFNYNADYYLYLNIIAGYGYTFDSQNYNVFINGEKVTVNEIKANEGELEFRVKYECAEQILTKVYVDVPYPAAGLLVKDCVSAYVRDTNAYIATTFNWYDDAFTAMMHSDDDFVGGGYYGYEITLIAYDEDGYLFDPSCEGYINGILASVQSVTDEAIVLRTVFGCDDVYTLTFYTDDTCTEIYTVISDLPHDAVVYLPECTIEAPNDVDGKFVVYGGWTENGSSAVDLDTDGRFVVYNNIDLYPLWEEHFHDYTGAEREWDAVSHYYLCQDAGCPDPLHGIKDEENHTYATYKSTACQVCGYNREIIYITGEDVLAIDFSEFAGSTTPVEVKPENIDSRLRILSQDWKRSYNENLHDFDEFITSSRYVYHLTLGLVDGYDIDPALIANETAGDVLDISGVYWNWNDKLTYGYSIGHEYFYILGYMQTDDKHAYIPSELMNFTFDANGGSGDMDPVIDVRKDEGIFLPECTFTAPSGKRFDRWSLLSGGFRYNPGDELIYAESFIDEVKVYAVWKDARYTISFDANGGSGEQLEVTAIRPEAKVYLPECTFIAPEGKFFSSWQLVGGGKNDWYRPNNPDDYLIYNYDEDVTFKAVWSVKHTATFDANGGSGTQAPIEGIVFRGYFTLPECTLTAPEGKIFKCWEEEGYKYAPGDRTYHLEDEDFTIKAIWADIYTLTFDANGGTGEQEPLKLGYNQEFVYPDCTFVAPEGKIFAYWQYVDDEDVNALEGDKAVYGAEYDSVFKAIWADKATVTIHMGGFVNDFVNSYPAALYYLDRAFQELETQEGFKTETDDYYLIGYVDHSFDTDDPYTLVKDLKAFNNAFIDKDLEFWAVWGKKTTPDYTIVMPDEKVIKANGELQYIGQVVFKNYRIPSIYDKEYYDYGVNFFFNGLYTDDPENVVIPGEFYNVKEESYYVTVNGVKVPVNDYNLDNDDINNFYTLAGDVEYVYLDCYGDVADFAKVDVSGKIAIVNRGSLTFSEKANNAHNAGAIGLMVVNNTSGEINMGLGNYEYHDPAVSVLLAYRSVFIDNGTAHDADGFKYYTGSLTISDNKEDSYMSQSYFVVEADDLFDGSSTGVFDFWFKLTDLSKLDENAIYRGDFRAVVEEACGGDTVGELGEFLTVVKIAPSVTITFNANGGSGSMAIQEADGEYTLPNCTFTAPDGKKFGGWSVNGATKQAGEKIEVTEDIELKAIWVDDEEPEVPEGPHYEVVDGVRVYDASIIQGQPADVKGLFDEASANNGKVKITFDGATIVFDATAVKEIAQGAKASLTVSMTTEHVTVEGAVFEFTADIDGVSDFANGKAEISLPFDVNIPEGKIAKLFYVLGGEKTDMNAEFKNGKVAFSTSHFSTYAVLLEDKPTGLDPEQGGEQGEQGEQGAGKDEAKPEKSGLSGGAIAGIVIGVVVALAACGAAVFFILKKKKKTNNKTDDSAETTSETATDETASNEAEEEVSHPEQSEAASKDPVTEDSEPVEESKEEATAEESVETTTETSDETEEEKVEEATAEESVEESKEESEQTEVAEESKDE
ncbi:MAG: InlB B-repeat-containing protein [Clostridia bacterium]|nr:InlB B-repeat-containing protein [Clostridia bacterium]